MEARGGDHGEPGFSLKLKFETDKSVSHRPSDVLNQLEMRAPVSVSAA
jgi:hypothetical protein